MRKLVILAGIPGTGKSTFAKNYFKDGKVVILSSDEIRVKHTGSYSKLLEDMNIVYREIIDEANKLFLENDNITVIIDSTCLTDERRNLFADNIKNYDYLSLFLLKTNNLSTIFKRNKMRIQDKWVPEEVIIDMMEMYRNPTKENVDKYDEIKEIFLD